MKLLLHLLFGYADIRVSMQSVKDVLNFAHKNRISLLKLFVKNDMTVFRVYMRDADRVNRYLEQRGIYAEILRCRGMPVLFRRYRHRVGMLSGIVVFFLALLTAPMFIWEINIEGLDRLSREQVTELLSREGVYVGAFSPAIDRQAVYTNILRSGVDISWLSVNIRGSSVNVEILEREYTEAAKHTADGANIVAAKRGIITDVQVLNGRATVQKGETVQAGTILVSGVYDTKKMGTQYVYADASVYAVVCDEFRMEIPIENTRREYGEEKVLEMSIKIFGKSINIFKNYSILSGKYDTIHREDSLPIQWLGKLPLSIETVCVLPFEDAPVRLSESDALQLARRELRRRIQEERDYLETISTEESFSIENDVLLYCCNVEAIENIAAVSEFQIDFGR